MADDERRTQHQGLHLEGIYERLATARSQREQFREGTPRPAEHDREQQQAWTQQAQGQEQQVGQARQELMAAAEQAQPDDIAAVQARIREQRQELERSMSPAQEQGAEQALGNAQEAGQAQSVELGQDWAPGNLEQLRAAREPRDMGRRQDQGMDRQQGDTPRLEPNWGAGAETGQDRAANRQLEADQQTLEHALGARPTDQQVRDFQERRAAAEKAQQGQGQGHGQEASAGQDLLANRDARRAREQGQAM